MKKFLLNIPFKTEHKIPHDDPVYEQYLQNKQGGQGGQLSKEYRFLGISIGFLIFLLIAKLLYVAAETVYNSIILDGVSSAQLTQEQLYNIEHLGHVVSAVGLVVLLLPVLYKLSYFFTLQSVENRFFRIIFIAISAFFAFLVTYKSFEWFMEYTLEQVENERYNAYYMTMLKQGILEGVLSYSTLKDRPALQPDEEMSIQDKVVLLNLYTLLLDDTDAVKKMVDKGVANIYRLRVNEFVSSDYALKEKQIMQLVNRVRYFWKKYNDLKEETNAVIAQERTEEAIKKRHEQMMAELHEAYEQYRYERENILGRIGWSLKHEEVEASPLEQWEAKMGKVSMRLESFEEYLANATVREQFLKRYEERGYRFGYDFDFSYEAFRNYYLNNFDNIAAAIIEANVVKSMKRFGIKSVNLNLKWENFIDEPFIQELLSKRIDDPIVRQNIILMLKKRDMEHFFETIYLPEVERMISQFLYKDEAQFFNDEATRIIGDEAIKALYIPPLAIFFSSLFGVLNFVIFIVMTLFLIQWVSSLHKLEANWKNILKVRATLVTAKLLLAAVLIVAPIIGSKHALSDYPLLETLYEQSDEILHSNLMLGMVWLLRSEPIIYTTGTTLRSMLPEEWMIQYGIESKEK